MHLILTNSCTYCIGICLCRKLRSFSYRFFIRCPVSIIERPSNYTLNTVLAPQMGPFADAVSHLILHITLIDEIVVEY